MGWNSQVVFARRFIGTDFEINENGAFFYDGPPGPGNLIISVANASGIDGYGNVYLEGIGLYRAEESGGAQVLLSTGAEGEQQAAALFTYINNEGEPGELYTVTLLGAVNAAQPDQAGVELSSSASDGSQGAQGYLTYTGPAGVLTLMGFWGYSGITLGAVEALRAADPATGSGPDDPAQPEEWHPVSLPSGVTGTIRCKMLAESSFAVLDVNVILTTSASGQSYTAGSLPDSAYYPAAARQFPLSVNQGMGASPSAPRVSIPVAGAIALIMPGFTTAGNACIVSGTVMYPLD